MQTVNLNPVANEWTLIAESPGRIRVKSNALSQSRWWRIFVTADEAPVHPELGEVLSGSEFWQQENVAGNIYIYTERSDDLFAITIGSSSQGGGGGDGGPVAWVDVINKPSFAQVATTGNFDHLINKPTIPEIPENYSWNQITEKPNFHAVAASGSFEDLVDKPLSFHTRLIHVAANGNDTTGDGSFGKPYATLQKAHDEAPSASMILLAPSTYAGDANITKGNLTISAWGAETSGIVNLTGTVTVNHTAGSIRLAGIRAAAINHVSANALYLTNCQVTTAFSSTGDGYLETFNCDLSGSTESPVVITLNGANFKVLGDACKLGIVTIEEQTTGIVTFKDILSSFQVTLKAGTLLMGRGIYYSPSNVLPSLVVTGGTVMFNGAVMVTPAYGQARISIAAGAFYQVGRVTFDIDNSSLAGTRLPDLKGLDGLKT